MYIVNRFSFFGDCVIIFNISFLTFKAMYLTFVINKINKILWQKLKVISSAILISNSFSALSNLCIHAIERLSAIWFTSQC